MVTNENLLQVSGILDSDWSINISVYQYTEMGTTTLWYFFYFNVHYSFYLS